MKLQQINIFPIMEKDLLKNKVILLLLFNFFVISCRSQEYSIEQVKNFKPTHQISNELIKEILNEIEFKKDIFIPKDNTINLTIIKKNINEYNISLTCLSFLQSKILNRKKKLKGYLEYKERILLLYGNIDNTFFLSENSKIEDIMKHKYVVDKNHPPYVIEPYYINFNVKNNIISKLN